VHRRLEKLKKKPGNVGNVNWRVLGEPEKSKIGYMEQRVTTRRVNLPAMAKKEEARGKHQTWSHSEKKGGKPTGGGSKEHMGMCECVKRGNN